MRQRTEIMAGQPVTPRPPFTRRQDDDKSTTTPSLTTRVGGSTPPANMTTETQPEQKPKKFFDPKANLKALVRLIVIVVILIGGVWLFIRFTAGQKAANTVTSTILRQRVDLVSTIVDLPAASLRTVSLSLPYTGTLSIDLAVKKGNDISVFVVTPDQIDKIKAKQKFEHVHGFEAEKTKSYRRSGSLAAGSYYLVLLDTSLGLLSQRSSDIQVSARLEP